MDIYFDVKIIHVVSACLFVCASFGSSLYLQFAFKTQNTTSVIKHHVQRTMRLNGILALPLAIIQLLTGFTIISVKPYSYDQFWIWGTFLAYVIFLFTWLISFYWLKGIKEGMPYIRRWQTSVLLSAVLLLVMIYFMANRTVF